MLGGVERREEEQGRVLNESIYRNDKTRIRKDKGRSNVRKG